MNVFLLDHDPLASSSYMVDDHVAFVTVGPGRPPIRSCKMGIEACQILSSAHWSAIPETGHERLLLEPKEEWPAPYKPTHSAHPWAVAIRSSREAYCLVRDHAQALLLEHEYRTGRTLPTVQAALDRLHEPPEWLESRGWRVPVCRTGLPVEYVSSLDEAIALYRPYYAAEKIARMPRFTRRDVPGWA